MTETKTPNQIGYVITREDAMALAGLLGSPCDTLEQLKRAAIRAREFSVAGADVKLETGVLERLRSRAKAARADPGEYLEREVKRLISAEVGF